MKVRIGVGYGSLAGFTEAVDHAEAVGVDSLWLSEVVFSQQVDPFIGMAHALARTTNLKVGTGVAVLPGRHPVLVAKQLVSLAALTPKRVLPVFGLQPARRPERQAFPVTGNRAAVFDETLRAVRTLLEQDEVTFHGDFWTIEGARLAPKPSKPLDIWLGGSAPAGLTRVGRLADGWLGSFLTPAQAGEARETIKRAADEAGREIEEDHYGMSIAIATDGIPPALAALARERRPDTDPGDVIPTGWGGTRDLVQRYVDAGITKFVIRPTTAPDDFTAFLDEFVTELMPLQN
ncbi:TIGR03854 family LLM class F420-dependent oxidoreductase [Actinocrispum wychmicini]|uniref:Putative F420-dependent oxidoreductase n=1 Tax=Actinocrispum wychmicini TaxID=1213861 RepID=A0A4R2JSR1_9PSEU|nr:TIGR03854 family LLM class F420-dependent oxidoreductase [Actinocrispum wychmicini]TCO62654.1 putative F420-dependent oxidoreductase [Actinocrispum wychmicini]